MEPPRKEKIKNLGKGILLEEVNEYAKSKADVIIHKERMIPHDMFKCCMVSIIDNVPAVDWNTGMVKVEIGRMMCSIQKFTFPLDYEELPLNKRFVLQFKDIVESKGFVVVDSLPQDSITIFGKS